MKSIRVQVIFPQIFYIRILKKAEIIFVKLGLIQSIKRIDYEKIKEINLVATVTDTGIPQLTSTASIVVDVINTNDNDPAFYMNEYVFKVLENSPKGTVIGKIDAKDDDDGNKLSIVYCIFFS